MSGVSLPVTRPVGRALIVGNPACRSQPATVLQRLGFQCAEVDDPYSAMIEICRRPLVYRALILSLSGLFREELAMIESVKRRYQHIEIWLSQTDGRQATLAEAMRLGADGLVSEDGLHRTAVGAPAITPAQTTLVMRPASSSSYADDRDEDDEEQQGGATQQRPGEDEQQQLHHPLAKPGSSTETASADDSSQAGAAEETESDLAEPVLTADELRALLQDQPTSPPGGSRADRNSGTGGGGRNP